MNVKFIIKLLAIRFLNVNDPSDLLINQFLRPCKSNYEGCRLHKGRWRIRKSKF